MHEQELETNTNPLKNEKIKKLNQLISANINPYPYFFQRSNIIKDIKEEYHSINDGEIIENKIFSIAGRLLTKRPMGKAAFFNIQDLSGNIQIYLKKSELSAENVKSFELIDIGDIVGIEGFVFKTKKGELSIHCQKFEILCKSIEPLPEKYHGIHDPELKYRLRHLDLIMDQKVKEKFQIRNKIIKEIRQFLDKRGFLEVETPILQPVYGGALANPFATHHNALNMQLFMKISPELYLKRLIVGGLEKVYELGKNFRNEGIDRSHNPEFTMLEWYEAYTDYLYQMNQFEELIVHLVQKIKGTLKITYQEKEIDFTPPWERITIEEGLQKYANIDVTKINEEELFNLLKKNGSIIKEISNKDEMMMELFEICVEKKLWNPTFVIDHPEIISPLAKKHRSKKNKVERFEPFVAGMEIGNAYSELNDPIEQKRKLKSQEENRIVNNQIQHMDEDFIHAIEVGMPPTGGVGLGVDRIIMILSDSASIRDIIFFPTMKHK